MQNFCYTNHFSSDIRKMVMTKQKIVELSRGILTLTYQSKGKYQLDDLLGFAERINPKRAFLFVSKVLGRHIPVAPRQMRQAFTDLANLIPDDLPEPILVVGMAETAVGLSAGFHQILKQRYPHVLLLNSTRHTQNGKLLTTFSEDHSHASQHLLYQSDDETINQQLLATKTLIMVDDEASTGKTCQNVVTALQQAGLNQLQQVHLATLVDWSLAKITPKSLSNILFCRHHLLSGNWHWVEKNATANITMPDVATTKAGSQPLLDTGNWGRLPTMYSDTGLKFLQKSLINQLDVALLKNKKVLVLGSNEFVWLPFLLAEYLENQGVNVKFSALTRSPIAINTDSAIKSVITFYDNYGLGMTNFVYNVEIQAWDLILLCVETDQTSVDMVWQNFDNVKVISPIV